MPRPDRAAKKSPTFFEISDQCEQLDLDPVGRTGAVAIWVTFLRHYSNLNRQGPGNHRDVDGR